jgi:hypothetical protein
MANPGHDGKSHRTTQAHRLQKPCGIRQPACHERLRPDILASARSFEVASTMARIFISLFKQSRNAAHDRDSGSAESERTNLNTVEEKTKTTASAPFRQRFRHAGPFLFQIIPKFVP